MRTKQLLLATAALAAGLASSQAQSNVYSVNIVGYVNRPAGLGFTAQANPVDASGSNSATNVINNSVGQWDGSAVYVWTGVSFTPYLLDSSATTGYTDVGGNPVTPPVLGPGKGFLFNNQTGSNVLTFVGSVAGSISNSVALTNTLVIPASPLNNLVSSPLPLGGGVFSALQLPSDGTLDGDGFQIPNIVNGNLTSWSVYLFDSSAPSGVTDVGGNPVAQPQIQVGAPILFNNNNASPVTWRQSIQLQ